MTGEFAAIAIAMYAGHHVGDYWVQTDTQARRKGDVDGGLHCLLHVITYMLTQGVTVLAMALVTGYLPSWQGVSAALFTSGVTHYEADRREHGLMFKLARKIPGKERFLTLGAPRPRHLDGGYVVPESRVPVPLDNPCLGTGAWALDQSWHIFWGVFVASLLMVAI